MGNYRQRIIVPIHYDGRMVSYQGRDVTGLQQERYKACARAQEAVPHKELLYGMDYLTQNRIIVCEGILDVWRMGPGAVCTFGVGYTQRQFLLLCEFPRVVLLYDMDTHGRQAAKVLGYNLETMGSEVWIPEYDASDPDSLTPRDASLLKEDIEKWYDRKEGSVTVARN